MGGCIDGSTSTPKRMVYSGKKTMNMDDLGLPPISGRHRIIHSGSHYIVGNHINPVMGFSIMDLIFL